MAGKNSELRYTLYIGTKNFSSWSLRAWLAMKMAGIEFTEVIIPLRQPETRAEIRRYSPSGKVPLLVIENSHGRELVWDSFAICETLVEQFPSAGLWPDDAVARAQHLCRNAFRFSRATRGAAHGHHRTAEDRAAV